MNIKRIIGRTCFAVLLGIPVIMIVGGIVIIFLSDTHNACMIFGTVTVMTLMLLAAIKWGDL